MKTNKISHCLTKVETVALFVFCHSNLWVNTLFLANCWRCCCKMQGPFCGLNNHKIGRDWEKCVRNVFRVNAAGVALQQRYFPMPASKWLNDVTTKSFRNFRIGALLGEALIEPEPEEDPKKKIVHRKGIRIRIINPSRMHDHKIRNLKNVVYLFQMTNTMAEDVRGYSYLRLFHNPSIISNRTMQLLQNFI